MATLKVKICASTLVETIISIVILIICMGIATVVVHNIFRADRLNEQFFAFVLAKNELKLIDEAPTYSDEITVKDKYLIERSFSRYKKNELLISVEVRILHAHDNALIYSIKKVLVNYNKWEI